MNELVITPRDELRSLISEEVQKLKSEFSPAKTVPQKEVFTNREAMKFLGVSRSTLQRWRDDGTLPFRKINGSIRYTRDDLESMLNEAAK